MNSSQEVTRSLRNKDLPIEDRIAVARSIIDGSLNVFLLQPYVVLLSWIFDSLTTETRSAQSDDMWILLQKTWNSANSATRKRIFATHKYCQILAQAFNESCPIFEIAKATSLIGQSQVIRCDNDLQAYQLLEGYLKQSFRHGPVPALSKMIFAATANRPNLFKQHSGALNFLLQVEDNVQQYLKDYFIVHSLVNVEDIPEDKITMVLEALMAAKVDFSGRFKVLALAFPQKLHVLLRQITVKVDAKDLEDIARAQMRDSPPNWSAMEELIKRIPNFFVENIDIVLETLDDPCKYSSKFVSLLIHRYAQIRELPAFVRLWANRAISGRWLEPIIFQELSNSLETLSELQLKQVLQIPNPALIKVLSCLSYSAVTSSIQQTLNSLALTDNWDLRFEILNIWPSIHVDGKKWARSALRELDKATSAFVVFRLYELGLTDIKYVNRVIAKWEPSSKEAYTVLTRFYPVLEAAAADMTSRIIKRAGPLESLLLIPDLLEFNQVRSAILQRLLSEDATLFLQSMPLEALREEERAQALTLAWNAHILSIAQHILSDPPGSTPLETDPRVLWEEAKKLNVEDANALLSITATLTQNAKYKQALSSYCESLDDTWQAQIIMTALGSHEPLSWAIKALKMREHLPAALSISRLLASTGNSEALASIASYAILEPSADVFDLLTRFEVDALALTAYFIHTGKQFINEFSKFCLIQKPDVLVEMAEALIRRDEFAALIPIFQALPKENTYRYLYAVTTARVLYQLQSYKESFLLEFLALASVTCREFYWLVNQYAVEATAMIVAECANPKSVNNLGIVNPKTFYEALCNTASVLMIYKRHRLYGRAGLILHLYTNLLLWLSNIGDFESRLSENCVLHYVRLVRTLCSPTASAVRRVDDGTTEFTSAVQQARRYMSKFIGILLENYACFALRQGFKPEIRSHLQRSVFEMLDLLGNGVKGVIAVTDAPTREFLRPIYQEYIASVSERHNRA